MTLIYRVDGMSCEHCVVAVTGEVGDVAGVAVGRRRPRRQARDACPAPPSTTPRWSRRSTRPATTRCRHERVAKLAGFAAVLGLVFGVATVAGGAIGPDREGADGTRRGYGGRARRDGGRPAGARSRRLSRGADARAAGLRSFRVAAHLAAFSVAGAQAVPTSSRARETHAPDRRPPRRHRLPAPPPRDRADGPWSTPITSRTRAPIASSPTSSTTARPARWRPT